MSDAPLTNDDARRFLADHPEIDGLDDVIAALLGARAERDEAQKRDYRTITASGQELSDALARATAAEAALATAKRDAWIAGRDAAEDEVRMIAEEFFEEDFVAGRIAALTPPAEAE